MGSDEANLDALCKKLGYVFKEPRLFVEAFRHASYVNEQADPNLRDNERLEFLGDAVLDLAISHLLMDLFGEAEEGELSKCRAMLVDEASLSRVAAGLRLGDYLMLGRGEEQGQGRQKPSILANTMEALLGALYLDAGFERVMEVIRKLFGPSLKRLRKKETYHDFKSLLQEFTQQNFKTTPQYRLVGESGPAHDKTFRVLLLLNGDVLAKGQGKSKKEAEQNAAREGFFCLKRS